MEGYAGLDPNLLLAKMGENGNDDKSWWLILLIMLYGRNGLGGGDNLGAAAAGIRDSASLADLNALQNSLQQCMVANTNAISERTLDITRDQAANALRNETGQMTIASAIAASNSANLIGQKDITQQICECCCKLGVSIADVNNKICEASAANLNATNVQGLQNQNAINTTALQTQNAIQYQSCITQNAIEKCCCENQNAILQQTNVITTAIRDDGAATRALITDNRMQDLQTQLQVCRDENSNLRQTEVLSHQIREQCGGHHWWMGNGGNGGPPGPPFASAPTATKSSKK
jgi:hypothetical protein